MNFRSAEAPLVTDLEVDALAWHFLNSDYVDIEYRGMPLDRRLIGFLRQLGLSRLAEDGDISSVLMSRVMAYAHHAGDVSVDYVVNHVIGHGV